MVRRWEIFGDFFASFVFTSRMPHISDLHSKFTLTPHKVATAENKRGKKKEEEERRRRKKTPQLENVMACPIGRPL